MCGANEHVCYGPIADIAPLFDYFVGAPYERVGNGDAERLGRFEIDDQFKLGCLHDWQFGRIFALENPPGMNAGPGIGHVRCN